MMESLTKHWNNLSLNEREGGGVHLRKDRSLNEFIAAKFLTKRALSIDAIIRTYNPLWRSKRGFEVRNVGDHIHDIPAPFMTREVAEELCGNAGIVDKTTDFSNMMGGSFMRVRVIIDASLPLCRGRLISFDEGEEGWVSFRYERLPNICYWCGCLNHYDKDCDRWIESDGSLKDEDKEYESWIRTTAAVLTKKSMVRVPGFYEARKKKPQPVGKGGGAVTSRTAVEHAEPSVSVETSKVVAEADFAEEFNVRIKIDEVKSAPTEKETPKPNLEGDSLERNQKETDEDLRRRGSNEGVIPGDLSNLIKAQCVT
uniref:Zinc knuckle CX2CX4HX4C domain-containing protein n=1 Tax=Quercus lobata TaxID=97700 RepID=A0A7N2LTL6_QUELO